MIIKNILNKRHNVTEYVFNNINRVVVHMNNTAFNRMSNTQYEEVAQCVKSAAICNSGRTICGTFKAL